MSLYHHLMTVQKYSGEGEGKKKITSIFNWQSYHLHFRALTYSTSGRFPSQIYFPRLGSKKSVLILYFCNKIPFERL